MVPRTLVLTLRRKIRESATTLAEGAKDIGINSATKIAGRLLKKLPMLRGQQHGTVASYMGYRITADIKDRLHKKHQEHDLRVAKQVLLDLLVKNANGKMKLFGLPEGCEKSSLHVGCDAWRRMRIEKNNRNFHEKYS